MPYSNAPYTLTRPPFWNVNLTSFTIIIIEYSKIYKLITCCCRRTQSTRSIFGDSSTNGRWLTFRGPWKQSLMRHLRMYNRSLYLYTVLSSYLFNEGWQPTLRYHTATYCVGVSIRLFTILSHIINMISILNFLHCYCQDYCDNFNTNFQGLFFAQNPPAIIKVTITQGHKLLLPYICMLFIFPVMTSSSFHLVHCCFNHMPFLARRHTCLSS